MKELHNKYLWGHVPPDVKAAGGRKGGVVQGYRRRAAMFRKIAESLPRTLTRQDILGALDKAYWKGYSNGWAVGKNITRQNSQNHTTLLGVDTSKGGLNGSREEEGDGEAK